MSYHHQRSSTDSFGSFTHYPSLTAIALGKSSMNVYHEISTVPVS